MGLGDRLLNIHVEKGSRIVPCFFMDAAEAILYVFDFFEDDIFIDHKPAL